MSGNGTEPFDAAIVGGGVAGLAAALACADLGLRTVLFAPQSPIAAGRTAALLQGSVELLAKLGVWPEIKASAAPLQAIRIVDDTQRLIRAAEVTFRAAEIGLPAFGYNVPNAVLVEVMRARAAQTTGLVVIARPVDAVEPGERSVALTAGASAYSARLVVAADGSRSLARTAAGIAVRSWSYPQSAIVATLGVQHPHAGVSTEFHTETGPFTLVPLPGDRVSLVWVDRPDRAEQTLALHPEAFARAAEERAHSIHGAMRLDCPPALFPLKAALAERFAALRTALVGEAAHTFAPIGAQGLNLGLRDVAALWRVLARRPADPGGAAALADYHAARQADIRTRTAAVDILNRSLLTDFLPVQAARGLGLALASRVPVVRRALMRGGLAAGGIIGRAS